MKIATHDRGEVLTFAGFHHLSPALRDGAPRLQDEGETAGRIGWEDFFGALDAGGLVLAWDTEDPSAAAPVPAAQGRPLERHPTFAAALERTRRFVRAFRREPSSPPQA
jgi:hypothetical protein